MKFTRRAKAQWLGSGMEGKGTLTTQSTVLNDTPYSFSTRFKDEPGTNPEELIGASLAGCFIMKLSFVLGEAGFTPTSLDADAAVTFENDMVSKIHLKLDAKVDGISKEKFEDLAQEAKKECPISRSLTSEITLEAKLS
jgi:osmotically inducible protein OsmC